MRTRPSIQQSFNSSGAQVVESRFTSFKYATIEKKSLVGEELLTPHVPSLHFGRKVLSLSTFDVILYSCTWYPSPQTVKVARNIQRVWMQIPREHEVFVWREFVDLVSRWYSLEINPRWYRSLFSWSCCFYYHRHHFFWFVLYWSTSLRFRRQAYTGTTSLNPQFTRSWSLGLQHKLRVIPIWKEAYGIPDRLPDRVVFVFCTV